MLRLREDVPGDGAGDARGQVGDIGFVRQTAASAKQMTTHVRCLCWRHLQAREIVHSEK